MFQALFHAWEHRLASTTSDRVVRSFDWGLDWIPPNGFGSETPAADALAGWVAQAMRDTDAFFTPEPTTDYTVTPGARSNERLLTFPTALPTPHRENNIVYCRYFGGGRQVPLSDRTPRRAVLILPQWNSDSNGHVALCRLLAMNGMTTLRLSLPYHDWRMPPELHRADYIVSANVARTLQVCRQAVLDARRAIAWLAREGFDRIGIVGTSLGSCLALLTTAHEPLVKAQALNHISPYFADVVWRGLSTRHVRQGLDGHIDLDRLRDLWKPISPRWYLERLRDRRTLLVYARYDLTFPVDLSEDLVREFRDRAIPHEVAVLPCGHYTSGMTPFKFVDAWMLTKFLKRALLS